MTILKTDVGLNKSPNPEVVNLNSKTSKTGNHDSELYGDVNPCDFRDL